MGTGPGGNEVGWGRDVAVARGRVAVGTSVIVGEGVVVAVAVLVGSAVGEGVTVNVRDGDTLDVSVDALVIATMGVTVIVGVQAATTNDSNSTPSREFRSRPTS